MRTYTASALRARCARRLTRRIAIPPSTTLTPSRAELSRRLAAIVARNLQTGRAGRALEAAGDLNARQLDSYIDRVIDAFLRDAARVDRLAAADETEWAQLFKQLTQRAQSMLSRIATSPATAPEAIEFAQAACEAIFRSTFPFDVSFDAWSTLILKNIIWQRYQRSRDVLDRNAAVESIERPPTAESGAEFSLHELLADPDEHVFEQHAVRDWLLAALEQLPSVTQERVLIDLYFNDRSISEVAHRLGRSVQAVYNLKHRALQELKRIMQRESFSEQSALNSVATHQEPRHGNN